MTRHRRTTTRTGLALIGLATALAAASASAGVLRSFTTIATTTGNAFVEFSDARINNGGAVAFSAEFSTTGTEGVFVGQGGFLAQIAGPTVGNIDARNPDINDAGTVTFFGTQAGVSSIFVRESGGPIVQVVREGVTVDNSGAVIANLFASGPHVSNGGTVVLNGESVGREGNWSSPSPYDTVFLIAAAQGDTASVGNPFINNANVVARRRSLNAGNEIIEAGGLTLADTNAGFSDLESSLDINDAGTVLFKGALDNGVKGVFLADASGLSTVVDDTGDFITLPSVGFFGAGLAAAPFTNLPLVAFTGLLPGFALGVFTGPDAIEDKVLVEGDLLFGKVVSGASVGPGGINDNGQIAMNVIFTDGTRQIVRASGGRKLAVAGGDREIVAQMSTRRAAQGGGIMSAAMSQSFTPQLDALVDLSLDYRFLTGAGELAVFLNDILLQTLLPPDLPTRELVNALIPLDLAKLFPNGVPGALDLRLVLSGADASVQIDNVMIAGLLNGDFQDGYLDEWLIDQAAGGNVVAVAAALTFAAPEPATLALVAPLLLALAVRRRGRTA